MESKDTKDTKDTKTTITETAEATEKTEKMAGTAGTTETTTMLDQCLEVYWKPETHPYTKLPNNQTAGEFAWDRCFHTSYKSNKQQSFSSAPKPRAKKQSQKQSQKQVQKVSKTRVKVKFEPVVV
jgi:hypothetical protein